MRQGRDPNKGKTMQMTEQAKEIRGEVLDEAAERYGRDKVASWADDPAKVRILNALAQMEADERGEV